MDLGALGQKRDHLGTGEKVSGNKGTMKKWEKMGGAGLGRNGDRREEQNQVRKQGRCLGQRRQHGTQAEDRRADWQRGNRDR